MQSKTGNAERRIAERHAKVARVMEGEAPILAQAKKERTKGGFVGHWLYGREVPPADKYSYLFEKSGERVYVSVNVDIDAPQPAEADVVANYKNHTHYGVSEKFTL